MLMRGSDIEHPVSSIKSQIGRTGIIGRRKPRVNKAAPRLLHMNGKRTNGRVRSVDERE